MQAERINERPRFWVGVVSASHVRLGVQGGYAQLCHGKAAPLRRMHRGDWLLYYSPRTDMNQGPPLQSFTAIGQVDDDNVYEYAMSESFVPFRRNIRYLPCREIAISRLLQELDFTHGRQHWGYLFRRGHFEIGRDDFLKIAQVMLEGHDEFRVY